MGGHLEIHGACDKGSIVLIMVQESQIPKTMKSNMDTAVVKKFVIRIPFFIMKGSFGVHIIGMLLPKLH